MSEPDIRVELGESKGRYVIDVDGEEAELTFSVASPKLRIADHTGVPDALRGTGIGRKLVEKLVSDARAEGFKVIPLCPFVNRVRQQHPEWSDVFSG